MNIHTISEIANIIIITSSMVKVLVTMLHNYNYFYYRGCGLYISFVVCIFDLQIYKHDKNTQIEIVICIFHLRIFKKSFVYFVCRYTNVIIYYVIKWSNI